MFALITMKLPWSSFLKVSQGHIPKGKLHGIYTLWRSMMATLYMAPFCHIYFRSSYHGWVSKPLAVFTCDPSVECTVLIGREGEVASLLLTCTALAIKSKHTQPPMLSIRATDKRIAPALLANWRWSITHCYCPPGFIAIRSFSAASTAGKRLTFASLCLPCWNRIS